MLGRNRRTVNWLLSLAAALLLAGCAATQGRNSSRDPSECPGNFLPYCEHSVHGTTCRCVGQHDIKAILRGDP